jgi:hypothetical protein
MTGDRLHADIEAYLLAAAMEPGPPGWPPDPLVAGATPIDQLLWLLGLAANAGDPADALALEADYAEREAALTGAAGEFGAQDEAAAALTQQVPQLAAGIAGAVGGALGGVLQPLGQLPAALAQGAGQALQTGLGMLSRAGLDADPTGSADLLDALEDPPELPEPSGDDLGIGDDLGSTEEYFGTDDFGGTNDFGGTDDVGAGGGPGGFGLGAGGPAGGTPAPAARLAPPAPFSPALPTAAPSVPPVPAAPAGTGAPVGAGMAGIPMVPPTHGGAGGDREPKPDTKRIAAPTVRNGAPVQGRLAVPPDAPAVTRHVHGEIGRTTGS